MTGKLGGRGERMRVTIDGSPKEIAALAAATQRRWPDDLVVDREAIGRIHVEIANNFKKGGD